MINKGGLCIVYSKSRQKHSYTSVCDLEIFIKCHADGKVFSGSSPKRAQHLKAINKIKLTHSFKAKPSPYVEKTLISSVDCVFCYSRKLHESFMMNICMTSCA